MWPYRVSPLGPIATTTLLGIIIFGGFVLNVALTHGIEDFLSDEDGAMMFRFAAILTLILCAAFGTNYFDDQASRKDTEDIKKVWPDLVLPERMDLRSMRVATIIGFAFGLGFLLFLLGVNANWDVIGFLSSAGLWFALVTPILWTLMARGIVGTVTAGNSLSKTIRDQLEIDLYRHHELAVFGRIAMRGAFVWLIFVGIILLFFADGSAALYFQPTLYVALGVAFWSFISTMQPVRSKIRAAKESELKLIREHLAKARMGLGTETSQEIPALIALEDRVERIREWPLDLPTAMRLPLYLLIPIVPWLGAGFAETMLGNMFGGGG